MLWTSSCAACTTAASRGRSFGTWRRQQTLFVVFSCDGLRRRWSKKARPCFSRRTVENLSAVKKKKKVFSQSQLGIGDQTAAPGRVRRTPPLFCASANQRSARLHGRQSPPPAGGTRSPVRFLRGVKPHFIFRPRHR